ncbi:MAG: LPS-assembly protein LptD [Sideroxydans sp.]
MPAACAEPLPPPATATVETPEAPGTAYLSARRVQASRDNRIEAEGEVELRQESQQLRATHLIYDQGSRETRADGPVILEQPGTTLRGQQLELNLDTQRGRMTQPEFTLESSHARGSAALLELQGPGLFAFDIASYTTCPAGNDDWLLNMSRLELDRNTQVGVAHHARIVFKGVPLLYTPWMDFPLGGGRKSGLLGPTFGSTTSGGSEFTLPLYLNLAPNYDATVAPRVIARRGTQFNTELRYLQADYGGEIQADLLNGDRLRGQDRRRLSLRHQHHLGDGLTLWLNGQHVSDDDYFRDLADSVSGTSQTNLLREGGISYQAPHWVMAARVQRYQTLQDPLAPVLPPYRRQPQVTLHAAEDFAAGRFSLDGEYADFRHPTLVSGTRLVFNPAFSYPLLATPGYYLTPRLALHHTRYHLDAATYAGAPEQTRTLPMFSLDGGLVLERSDSLLGAGYMQTLEPRAFYVRVPYADQSALPNFDTAQAPFSFSQLFTENRFLGNDRVGDADNLTLALTSRVIDDEDGNERLRVAMAQRFIFRTPQVNLTPPADARNRSDILTAIGGQLTRAWSLDSLVQYNPNQGYTESYSTAARYRPEPGKLLNLGYRFSRNTLRQMDISTQWPLSGRWHGVGRFNYSLQDQRILEALGGLEYNAACWTLRLVAQSFTSATSVRTTGFFIQLELDDLVRIGTDPLTALRNSVSGYTKLNELPAPPQR